MSALHQQAIETYTRLLEAWNRRDAEGFASLFTAAANVVGFDGSQMNGREPIAAELRSIFASHPTAAYVAKVREVRDLAPGVVLLRAVVGMVRPGTTELNPAVNAVQSLVLVREPDVLRIELLHNTPAAFHGRPQLAEQLTRELEPLAGTGRIVEEG